MDQPGLPAVSRQQVMDIHNIAAAIKVICFCQRDISTGFRNVSKVGYSFIFFFSDIGFFGANIPHFSEIANPHLINFNVSCNGIVFS